MNNKKKDKHIRFNLLQKVSISFITVFVLFFFLFGFSMRTILKSHLENYGKNFLETYISREVSSIKQYFKRLETLGNQSGKFILDQLETSAKDSEFERFFEKHHYKNGALRTNLQYHSNQDISAIFLSNRSRLTEEIKRLIIQTEAGFDSYAKSATTMVFNMYFISKENMIRIYRKDWALEIEADHLFKNDIFYKIATPENNPERKGLWTTPYYDSIWKHWMTSFITPIYRKNRFIGIVGHDVILDDLYKNIVQLKLFNKGYSFIFDSERNIIVYPQYHNNAKVISTDIKAMGTALKTSLLDDPLLAKTINEAVGNPSDLSFKIIGEDKWGKRFFISQRLDILNWHLAVIIPESDMISMLPPLESQFFTLGTLLLFVLLIIILAIVFIFFIKPLKILIKTADGIRKGNLDLSSDLHSKDEIGDLSNSFDEMIGRLKESLRDLEADIQIRQKVEAELRESKNIFEMLFENSPFMITLTSKKKGKFIKVNKGFEAITGYSSEEALENSISEPDLWFNKDHRDDFAQQLDSHQSIKDFDMLLIRKDKRVRRCQLSSVEIQLGGASYQITIVNDITDQEEAKKERSLLKAKLEQSKKMEAIGTLAGGVAHDLNNILSGILSYPDLMLLKIKKEDPLRKYLLTIRETGKKAANIVQDLLTLARRGVAATKVVNLNTIIQEYLNSPEFKKLKSFHPKLAVKKTLKENLFNIQGSTVHLSKTIMNLVSNAAEAMPEGGTVHIATRNLFVENELNKYERILPGNYVIVEITDNGTGISENDLERIFDPFYTKKKMGQSGTGLGMAVVWGTVKDHEGFIDVQSKVGEGTTFVLYFPITNREMTIEDTTFSIGEYMGHGEKIMIIDDMAEQRQIAVDILNRLGYTPITAENGEQAIRILKKDPVDLLLLDMIMGMGMDGLDTYKEALKLSPNQKAIIISGYSETERVSEAISLGVSVYIKKPYSVEMLAKNIRAVLRSDFERDE